MNEKKVGATEPNSILIFACSGGSDVGALSDQVAWKLMKDGAGKMYCLAGIGGRVSGIMTTAQSATKILAIDGCAQNCAQKVLDQAGFASYTHLKLADLGIIKGKSSLTTENIEKVAAEGAILLR